MDAPNPAPTSAPPTAPASEPPLPPPEPGERRLSRPPSDRYRAPETAAAASSGAKQATGSPGRGVAFAAIVAIAVALAITVMGGVLLVSAGLIVVAAAGGWAIAVALRLGSAATIQGPTRRWLALGIAVAAVVLGQIGLWLFARTEGGVLQPIDYLAQTFGPIVLAQLIVAPLVAAWSSR